MKILVCISDVADTTTKVKFKDNNTAFETAGVQWIINPWDELSLTRAVELKESSASLVESITVVTVGPKLSEATIRKALAIGADNAIRIDAEPKDAYFVAAQIAEVVKAQSFDIIFTGIDSADYNGSAVGGMLAEMLQITALSSVSSLKLEDGKITVTREIEGGTETIETVAPFLAVVQKGIALEPKIPAMRGIMMARTKPLAVQPLLEIESLTSLENYEMPQAKGACKKFDAESVKELVDLLHNEAKMI